MQAGGVAPAAGDAQPQYVFIKRAGGAAADDEVYAEVAILPGDTVARLAERACAKFGWGVPSQASLFFVDHLPGGDEPSALVEAKATTPSSRRLQSGWTLERAGVEPKSWLLARVSLPPAAAGASCATHDVGCPHPPLPCARSYNHSRPPPASHAGGAGAVGGVIDEIVEQLGALQLEMRESWLELKLQLSAVKKQIAVIGYNASHALTAASQVKLNRGALFRVHDKAGEPLFCGFFVDERVALTINHDELFKREPPFSGVSGCSSSTGTAAMCSTSRGPRWSSGAAPASPHLPVLSGC